MLHRFADSIPIKRGPGYLLIDEARERRSKVQTKSQSSNQAGTRQHEWTALFTRPVFIVMIVTFVLLIFTGLIFVTAFSLCRHHRMHRKTRLQSMTTYANASQSYGDKEHNKADMENKPIKLSSTRWTPNTAVIYQPIRSELRSCTYSTSIITFSNFVNPLLIPSVVAYKCHEDFKIGGANIFS